MGSGRKLIVVGGPTASGKTTLAIELALRYGTEIISGDSRQFYREMRIGNARPTEEELAAVQHHFIADRSLLEPLSAGDFEREASALLAEIFARNEVAILVGGSGLYLRALYEGLDDFPPIPKEVELRVGAMERPALAAYLATYDPAYYATVDVQNSRRLARAVKVCLAAEKPYSSFLGRKKPRDYGVELLRTDVPREALYARIETRVDAMLDAGLEAEAKTLHPYRELPILQTVGYQEWWPYFGGEYPRERAVELIKRNSRRYAKRQGTWLRGAGFNPRP